MSDPLVDALWLLKRQSELETLLGDPAGIRVNEERELLAVRDRLERYPHALRAIAAASAQLHRPIDSLSAQDVLGAAGRGDAD